MAQNLAVSLVKEFQASGINVPKLQLSNIGDLCFAAAYDDTPKTIVVNESSAGMDFNPDVAISKALVEYLERKAFFDGISEKNPICDRLHSDGIAAYPRSNPQAGKLARQNAYSEALERYVWASWWDNENIGHDTMNLNQSSFGSDVKIANTMMKFNEILPLELTTVVEPFFDDSEHYMIILFSKIKGYGYISGGAAGIKNNRRETLIRAMSELIRHGIAIARFLETKVEPANFYERRLVFFGLGHGNAIVEHRLKLKYTNILLLPELVIDAEIKSKITDNIITTHRCLFKDQPPFVDGKLERLCL